MRQWRLTARNKTDLRLPESPALLDIGRVLCGAFLVDGNRKQWRNNLDWLFIFQAVGFFRVESWPPQAVLPLVGLAAEQVIRDWHIRTYH